MKHAIKQLNDFGAKTENQDKGKEEECIRDSGRPNRPDYQKR